LDRSRSFGFLLTQASRSYVQRFEQRARELGLTLPQCRALTRLAQREGISQSHLSELADIEPMTLVRILDRMESDGWVERRSDPADRRARRLYLKPKSKPLLEQIWRLSDMTREEAFAGFSRSDAERFISLLEKVGGNLTSLEPLPTGAPPRNQEGARGSPPARARRERSISKT
jgi:MarR family transcriptional regulator for hemolysin